MNYTAELGAIVSATRTLKQGVRRLGWALARTIPTAWQRTAAAKLAAMKADNEAVRFLPRGEHARILRELEQQEAAARMTAAGVARFAVEPAAARLRERYQAFVAVRRRDVVLSFPEALNHMSPGDMLTFELLKETIRPAIESAEPAELLRLYARALETKDPRGLIEATLIEQRMDRGGLARTEGDLPHVKRLAELVDGVRELRVPIEELGDVDSTLRDAERAAGLADAARVRPADPTKQLTAKEAFEKDEADYQAALAREAAGQ